MKTLVMMVGLPRSGKTTVAMDVGKSLCAPIVSPDDIRVALHGQQYVASAERFVWATAHLMVRALFRSHDFVILDACSHTQARRAEWKSSGWRRNYKVVEIDKAKCIARAEGDERVIAAIERMAEAWEPIGESEWEDES